MFQSNEFRHAFGVTFVFALITVPIGLALGIGLAVLADKHLRGMRFFRTVYSSTVATSVAVASLIWLVLLQPQIGVLANLLPFSRAEGAGPAAGPDVGAARRSASVSIWANAGFTFIIMTAGLQSIPRELYESAFVDGAGGWRRFTNVTLPLLGPTHLVRLGGADDPRAPDLRARSICSPAAGPRATTTTTVTYLIYGQQLVIAFDNGLQATVAVLLFVIMLIVWRSSSSVASTGGCTMAETVDALDRAPRRAALGALRAAGRRRHHGPVPDLRDGDLSP